MTISGISACRIHARMIDATFRGSILDFMRFLEAEPGSRVLNEKDVWSLRSKFVLFNLTCKLFEGF